MSKILVDTLVKDEIKHSSQKIQPIRFKEDVINKIKNADYTFGNKRELLIPFKVDKDGHRKGLKLKIFKGTQEHPNIAKIFVLQFWLNDGIKRKNKKGQIIYGLSRKYKLGKFSTTFGTIECDKKIRELRETHTNPETGVWVKDPNITARDEKRIIPKKDTSQPAGKTVNEVLESYCGADEAEGHRGFLKDVKQGYKTSKSAKTIFRCLAGYNKRQSLATFEDDDRGYCVRKFRPNKHLRIVAPKTWKDLFRKFPPGHGILKDRVYYNRRKKQTYTIPASKNKSIYDSSLGKSLIEDLTTGDVEDWCKDLTSMEVKKDYVKCFSSLWFWARKRGWLGTNPGLCPITLDTVYVKKEFRKESKYTDVAISLKELEVFHECSEELSWKFPFKAELHQLMAVTGLRKAEAIKLKKSYIDFEGGLINVPKGINKQRFKDQIVEITPEVEIVLRNILDMGNRPGLEFYKMKDFPWLFATRRWSAEKYFNKEFRLSIKTRLGGDEKYIPALRDLMRYKLEDPELVYAPKVLRKTFITLSRQQLEGRSDKVKHLSRHKSEEVLERSYDKPSRAEIKDWANKTTQLFTFIRRRSA